MTIKVINSTNLRSNLSDTLDDVSSSHEAIIVKRHKRADVALVNIEFLEDLLELHNKDYLKSIADARASVKEGDTFSYEEIFGEL